MPKPEVIIAMPAADKKNYIIAVLACTTLAGAGLLVQARAQLAEARRAPKLQLTQTDFVTTAAPTLISAPSLPIAAESPLMPAPVGATTQPPVTPTEAEGSRSQRGALMAAQMAKLMQDPEFTEAWKIQLGARIEQRYGELFRQLNLSPERSAQLTALLMERESAGRDVWATAAAKGINPRQAREELDLISADLRAEVDANIERAFGPQIATALETYSASSAPRSAVNTLSQTFASKGQPLNSYQSQQLMRVIAETGQPSGRNSMRLTEATITQASGFLSTGQVAALQKELTVQTANEVVEKKTRAAREAAGGGGGGWRRDD
ncbi:MAG: hypothetical protein EAZ36_02690 [Verrucomicrobia bacterium]|nr:MAG: hypothetical protein EAZ36_02690 [Verrucomicrobiota bacterium]